MSDKGFESYQQYLRGDEYALEELVRTYSDPLVRFIFCYVQDASEAEDIMEDTIVTLIMKNKRFSDGDKLHGYLYKIARNKAIDYLRWHRRHVPLEDVEKVLAGEDLTATHSRRARDEKIYSCMQSMPKQYKEVLHLTYFEDLPLQQVSRIMGKSMKQIYNLHARAKTAIKELLIKEGIDHEDL